MSEISLQEFVAQECGRIDERQFQRMWAIDAAIRYLSALFPGDREMTIEQVADELLDYVNAVDGES